ncbi:MAG: response regulator [Piscinibacter sp.]|nr:response regulator [Piscinibacter sp.]
MAEENARLCVRFEVRDTGPGIPEGQQAHLFTAFEQADNSTTRRHGGTGLGLALTRRIAQHMGGTAGVDSAPGRGSTFWFTAWLDRVEKAPDVVPDQRIMGHRALLVDDLDEARAPIQALLESFGMQTDAVDGGPAALKAVERLAAEGRRYDLVVIDWRMEPMDGLATLQALRQARAEIPAAILVTAFDHMSLRPQAEQAGFRGVLSKPITASALHDELARIFSTGEGRASTRRPADHAAEATEAAASLRRSYSRCRVLLAEDNPVNQEVAGELLKSVGLDVTTVQDGVRAVDVARGGGFDLILMDVQMPEMDGLTAARAIRARGLEVPIIAMTANAFDDDRDACLAAGMNDHVAKPVDPGRLFATIERWLSRDRTPSEGPDQPQDPEVEAARWTRELRAVRGLDLSTGLRRLGGDVATYARIAQRFAAVYRPAIEAFERCETPAERAACAEACHSLRGACGSVGALALADLALALETSLRSASPDETVRERIRRLEDELAAFVGELDRAIAAALATSDPADRVSGT